MRQGEHCIDRVPAVMAAVRGRGGMVCDASGGEAGSKRARLVVSDCWRLCMINLIIVND
jgi:hypothetical protein